MRNCVGLTLSLGFLVLAASPAVAQHQTWIRQLGTSAADNSFAAAPDGSGGVYVSGWTVGSLGGPHAGGVDAWLARYDSAGSQTWIRQLGTGAYDYAWAAAPDGSGGVYVCGATQGSLGGPIAGLSDAWVARYDSAGNQTWIRQLGTSSNELAVGAAPDGSGGVYVCGRTFGNLGGPTAGDFDAWLARYDGAGNQTWIRQFGTSNFEDPYGAAPDGSGGVYVSGLTTGSLGGPYAGGYDAWLARYDSAGNQTWIRQLGTSGHDYTTSAAPDVSGGVYVSGWSAGALGGPNAGDHDVWLARYDGAGNQIWIRQFGTSAFDAAYAVAPDVSGGVYVSGETRGGLGGPTAGDRDAWFARYDSAGNQIWIYQFGTSDFDGAYAAAQNGSGSLYLSGRTYGSLGGPNAGGSDAWLARYDVMCRPTTYCTSKLNSLGCTPLIAFTGAPSASAGFGFPVSCANVRNNKSGLLFYKANGAQAAVSFQGGFLCVGPSGIKRTGAQSSGGNPAPANDCTGTYALDMNLFAVSTGPPTPDPALTVPGTVVHCQWWGRDPGFPAPGNVTLSNGLEYSVCP